MKVIFLPLLALIALFFTGSSTMNNQETIDSTLPNTSTPSEMVGGWSNGFATFTQVVDAYSGRLLGNTWQSGKYISFTPDGTNVEFYIFGGGQNTSFATQVSGTIRFDAESTNSRGSFTLLALKGHYKAWSSTHIDRDATPEELKKNLTRKYFYRMDGEWLRIESGTEPNDYSSSFRKVQN